MIDLDNCDLEIACPRCRFINDFTFRQARLRDVIICRGCKCNLRLDDHLNTMRKARRTVGRAVEELEETLKSLGSITIRL